MTESGTPDTQNGGARLHKALRLSDVFAISTGGMLGSGLFLLPGLAYAAAGPSAVLAYFVAALLVIPAMVSKAELATAMPRAGGAYYFLDRSLGPIVGTIGGLGTWVAQVLKNTFVLIGMGAYLGLFFDVEIRPIAVGLTVFFLVLNVVGAKETGGLQKALVLVLMAFCVLFVGGGAWDLATSDAPPTQRLGGFMPGGVESFVATVGLVFVSFAGLTKAASVSEEVREPDRNIPRGMALSLATVTFVYVAGVFLMAEVLGGDALSGDLVPVASAGERIFDWMPGRSGVVLVVVAAVVAFASAANAGVMAASRYLLAMGRDGLVPPALGRVGRFHTPTLGVLATSGLMILLILTMDVMSVAKLASAFQLMIFGLVNLAVIVMRESGLEAYDPGFRSPLYPWLQIVGLLAPILLIATMGFMPMAFTVVLVGACLAWYFWYARDRVTRGGALLFWFERLGQQRFEGLDRELRTIMKEKGLRAGDPFDEVVARAAVVDPEEKVGFEHVVRRASAELAKRLPATADKLRHGFMEGTRIGMTPVAHGVALPHLRLPGLDSPEIVLARSRVGITMDVAGDLPEQPQRVHAAFFLVSPEEDAKQHLRILAQIAGRVDDDEFMGAWLSATSEHELKEAVLRDERFLGLVLEEGTRSAPLIGSRVADLDLPDGCLLALVARDGATLIPGARTRLRDGDRLTLIGEPEVLGEVTERWGEPSAEASEARSSG
ncbi:MAG: amino acid permease [Myxococcota bacterium]